ncbi:MAG: methyltransferase domain-containing protein [Verrucomicrobia bacterium]|nr:methyltransferase domain-containing protein [Verrucomicrobiota bacterium]
MPGAPATRMNLPLVNETHPDAATLRVALDRFYQTSPNYGGYVAPSDQSQCWRFVVPKIEAIVRRKGSCRALEIGAGRTGFRQFYSARALHFAVQDVTGLNADYLRTQADEVFIGDLPTVTGRYDVIFSTFVFEHVTNPRATLELAWQMVEPGGALFLFCPRYDVPFYLPPSFDHRPALVRWLTAIYLLGRRAWTALGGPPAFLVTTDPSVFHREWARDRDAIHLVSLFDLRAFARGRGPLTRYALRSGSVKDWVVKNLLQINAVIEKPDTASPSLA